MILEVTDLSVSYHENLVLWDVDLAIPDARMVGIVGPNGAGKSTLLKAMMGLIPVQSGTVRFWGGPLSSCRQRVAYVPQRETVDWDFPISAYDVVMMGRYGRLGWFKRPRDADHMVVRQALDRLGIGSLADRQIGQLSGGQQQRVFLARAVAQEAELYLLDEPFVGIDAATERTIVELLRELRAQGKLVMVVHHDLARVKDYFDSVLLFNMRSIAYGPVAEVFTEELLDKTYAGRLNLVTDLRRSGSHR